MLRFFVLFMLFFLLLLNAVVRGLTDQSFGAIVIYYSQTQNQIDLFVTGDHALISLSLFLSYSFVVASLPLRFCRVFTRRNFFFTFFD